ncbi:hypothetical protein [Actinoallomurus sp. NPDC050550]|uniref:hypothetical protein n=1 Tax=Actinoallomurus sp. NPDC050550 TaxID=3154937 RepID=UPI0033F35334
MSRNSQQGDGTILVAAFDTAGWQFDRHHHEENQLAWAATGVPDGGSARGSGPSPGSSSRRPG